MSMNRPLRMTAAGAYLLAGFFSILAGTSGAQHPFRYDSLYPTLYAGEFCRFIRANPDVVLIDVRTPGEFSDTSHFASLNKGRLKGAINIPVDTIRKDLHVLDPFKDRPMIFYCSHSQRSRRVSKLLSEQGYSRFYNLNGGMTSLNELREDEFPCKDDYIITGLPYQNLSCDETAALLENEKHLVIIDVRPASHYDARDSLAENNVGRIRKAIHLPYEVFGKWMHALERYKNRPILVYTSSGDGDGARAATALANQGFAQVHLLLAGLQDFMASGDRKAFMKKSPPYTLVDAYGALHLLKNRQDLVVFDTRAQEDYNNERTGMDAYRNLGHIQGAIHATNGSVSAALLPRDKKMPLLVYGNEESCSFALYLHSQGYRDVYVLPGFYGFVWSAFNVERCRDARQFLTGHAGLY